MLSPRRTHPFLPSSGVVALAHRGWHGDGQAPENTMAAFKRASDIGYDYLETDVRLTADGYVCIFHDEMLDRVTDATGLFGDRTWAELRRVQVGGTDPIPLLDEVLDAFPTHRFNVDPKHDAVLGPLMSTIRRHRAESRVNLAAFSDRRLRRARALGGAALCTALGPRENTRLLLASRHLIGPPGAGQVTQVPIRHGRTPIVTRAYVEAAHRAGLAVHVWTVNDPDEMHRLIDLGVDGIMTDHADRLRAVLTDRGLWQHRTPQDS